MKINKYLSFDISLHKTLYSINKDYSNTCLSYKALIDILNSNWLSTGYQSSYEEALFKYVATTTIKIYSLNPLDRGCDILLLDKFITDTEGPNLKYVKIDKLHFLSNGQLELIDYKSGKHIPPTSKSFYTSNLFFTDNSIKKNLGVYPDIFSLYYLRYGLKISNFIDSDNFIKTIHVSNSFIKN